MTTKEIETIFDNLILNMRKVMKTKGAEYSSTDDRLYNFKQVAEQTGSDSKVVWAAYFQKHVNSIMSYIKNGRVMSDELIEGRILDACVYLLLFQALVSERDSTDEK